MTILSWMAGFEVRTGWRFLSEAESDRLSARLTGPGRGRVRALARHVKSGDIACLDAAERDPSRARLLILSGEAERHTQVREEFASLKDWIGALGLAPKRPASGGHDVR